MNKSALKKFATEARRELLERIKLQARKIGITSEGVQKATIESSDAIFIDGKQLKEAERVKRNTLISRIHDIGFDLVMEEVAYTWFNRFTALRFMEVNDYLPTKVRVLSSTISESKEPDMMKEALKLDLDLDKQYVYELKLNNNDEELFKYLIIKHCNDLNRYMPFMFETIDDYTEILFPNGLLAAESFVTKITNIEVIPESNWKEIEVIGWLYQYYIAEEKDRVIKAKKKYEKDEITFATQLFTPAWIVKYMTQNSLGRYWLEAHPEHNSLKEGWEFYLDNAESTLEMENQLKPYINGGLKVEDIKCFDPAMGSGHILVYMFDMLFEIYNKCGYTEREIPRLIIENNLHGLDIDDRAYQLASFSVVMKALEYNSRFLKSIEREGLKLNLSSIQETNILNDNDIAYIAGSKDSDLLFKTKNFIQQFKNAKIYGSLIKVPDFDKAFLENRMKFLENNPATNLFDYEVHNKVMNILPSLIKQARIMNQQYDVLVTNPPYMGGRHMPKELGEYIATHYDDYRGDLFSAFVDYIGYKTNKNGHIGLITPYVWMFIKNYFNLRKKIVFNQSISSLVELEYNSFEGATVPVCAFTLRNYQVDIYGQYIKLAAFKGISKQPLKVIEAVKNPDVNYRFNSKTANFKKVTGYRIAYWFNEETLKIFKNDRLEDYIDVTGSQNITSNNNKYLRYHWEVEKEKVMSNRWPFYNKGGEFRKWFGNDERVIDWSDNAKNFYRNSPTANLLNERYWFREGLSYNGISNRGFSVRKVGRNIYDKGGPTFHPENYTLYLLALLNSKCVNEIMNLYNPTLNYQVQDVKDIPVIIPEEKTLKMIEKISEENLEISREEWNSYETSWGFSIHPFLKKEIFSDSLEDAFRNWDKYLMNKFDMLKSNEEKINDIILNLYELTDNFSSKVSNEDVTIDKANLKREVRSFISYFVGCLFGRYSLEEKGLNYAGGIFENSSSSFKVDGDNIVPILSESYFDEDIVREFSEFLCEIYGTELIEENINFIAEALGKKKGETAKETIRRYFLNEFYKNHFQIYKKRPIYWLFTSGKEKAFNCLIYMHRYDKTTLSRIRTDYLHEIQIRMDSEKKDLLNVIYGDSSTKEISNAKKELKSLDKKIDELKAYDEKLHHMADMQIEIDLDHGVAVNYAKFEGLVAKI